MVLVWAYSPYYGPQAYRTLLNAKTFTFIFVDASFEHANVPFGDRSAEFAEGMFQFLNLVFEVVDVQILRIHSIADHSVEDRRRHRVGTERQQHDHTSSPHTAAAAAAAGGGDGI